MTLEPSDPSSLAAILQVERLYAGLIRNAGQQSDGEPTLGGQLLYAGELDAEARALTIAANIAGAATLAATADAGLQKQAIRDGVVDFLVTSLDEVVSVERPSDPRIDPELARNVVVVTLTKDPARAARTPRRATVMGSACGVCGRTTASGMWAYSVSATSSCENGSSFSASSKMTYFSPTIPRSSATISRVTGL